MKDKIEAQRFDFDPKSIDWKEYFYNIHIPGVLKYLQKWRHIYTWSLAVTARSAYIHFLVFSFTERKPTFNFRTISYLLFAQIKNSCQEKYFPDLPCTEQLKWGEDMYLIYNHLKISSSIRYLCQFCVRLDWKKGHI